MPIYGYVCKSCEHSLDALQKISDDPLVDCPQCGKPELKRQLSAPRFRLKGQGWYETDFKKDNKRNLVDGKGDGESKGDGKSDAKTDKPDAKPAADAKPSTSGKAETKKPSGGSTDKASA